MSFESAGLNRIHGQSGNELDVARRFGSQRMARDGKALGLKHVMKRRYVPPLHIRGLLQPVGENQIVVQTDDSLIEVQKILVG
mgnify:FL=1